jgi:hypothetical protein
MAAKRHTGRTVMVCMLIHMEPVSKPTSNRLTSILHINAETTIRGEGEGERRLCDEVVAIGIPGNALRVAVANPLCLLRACVAS